MDFKNTIIIMTSNAGAQAIIEPKRLGFGSKEDEKQDHQHMKNSVMEEILENEKIVEYNENGFLIEGKYLNSFWAAQVSAQPCLWAGREVRFLPH